MVRERWEKIDEVLKNRKVCSFPVKYEVSSEGFSNECKGIKNHPLVEKTEKNQMTLVSDEKFIFQLGGRNTRTERIYWPMKVKIGERTLQEKRKE